MLKRQLELAPRGADVRILQSFALESAKVPLLLHANLWGSPLLPFGARCMAITLAFDLGGIHFYRVGFNGGLDVHC